MNPVCCYSHCKSSLSEMSGVHLIYALGLSVYWKKLPYLKHIKYTYHTAFTFRNEKHNTVLLYIQFQ
jgi:hypothetical protein